MKCCICNTEITAPWSGRKPKYCSKRCRDKAYHLRKKMGAKAESPCPRRKKAAPQPPPKPRDEQPLIDAGGDGFEYTGHDIPSNRHWDAVALERDLDEPLEVTLRRSKAKLQRVIDDSNTPAGAISNLTKTLIEVSEKLEAVKKDQPSGLDLLAAPIPNAESENRHGAQII
ncbi:hypothetical protein [Bifidobacterium animalis]|uniref:hypothetical protein n=1 Tax=Bifidobacterium animalis TaxID=28025 RepID=UPI001C3F09B3|nr:hypothetical protein [Bifidobacterium animalis]MCR1995720.1 hypothetical protein [Bifidobacterium animalis subsp. animalis]